MPHHYPSPAPKSAPKSSRLTLTPFIPTITLLTLALLIRYTLGAAYLPARVSPLAVSPPARALLLFHFTHANILHLLANAAALLYFRPRWKTLALAYPAAILAALLYLTIPLAPVAGASAPASLLTLPTCGLSAIVCACFARRYVAYHKSPLPFILIQLPFILLPNFNFIIHILSFIIAYIAWRIIYKKNGR